MDNLSLAKMVKELRTKKGYSQEFLAEESGLSLRTIQRIENDETVPRGDTLKRLAGVLETSPDDLVNWKIQEDPNYLTLMNLSALSFLLFPVLGIIIPLTLWILKKDKLKHVNQLGKSILNFQISWTLLLFLCYILIFTGIFVKLLPNWNLNLSWIIIIVGILYVYNIIVIVYNAIQIYNRKSFKYGPALKILH
jgi:uncharacterized Tic20 family protein